MRTVNKTKEKIWTAIKILMKENKMNDISVKDICNQAGIAVGTFYHHYTSKAQAFLDISNPIDLYFENIAKPDLENLPTAVKLSRFFQHQAYFMVQYALDNNASDTTYIVIGDSSHFFSKERITYRILYDIVNDESLYREWKKVYSCEDITNHLLYLARGIVINWIGHNYEYDLAEMLWKNVMMTKPY